MKLLANIPLVPLLAQANLQQNLGQVAGVLNAIAAVLFFGGLLMAAIMFMIGRTEYLKYGLVGLGGLAWVIVTTFFRAENGTRPEQPCQHKAKRGAPTRRTPGGTPNL